MIEKYATELRDIADEFASAGPNLTAYTAYRLVSVAHSAEALGFLNRALDEIYGPNLNQWDTETERDITPILKVLRDEANREDTRVTDINLVSQELIRAIRAEALEEAAGLAVELNEFSMASSLRYASERAAEGMRL